MSNRSSSWTSLLSIKSSSHTGLVHKAIRVESKTSELETELWTWTLQWDSIFHLEPEESLLVKLIQNWLSCLMTNSCTVVTFMAIAKCTEELKFFQASCSTCQENLLDWPKKIIKLLKSSRRNHLKAPPHSLMRTVKSSTLKMSTWDNYISPKNSALLQINLLNKTTRIPQRLNLRKSLKRRLKMRLTRSMSPKRIDQELKNKKKKSKKLQ